MISIAFVNDMTDHDIDRVPAIPPVYDLLDRLRSAGDVVLRDDQTDAPSLVDAARSAKHPERLKLVDTGRFAASDIEDLGRAGARLYTSDEAGRSGRDLFYIQQAFRAGGSRVFYLQTGPFPAEPGNDTPPGPGALASLAGDGLDVHVTDREIRRDSAEMAAIAAEAVRGGSFCVFYHHGGFEPSLVSIAAAGAWIHMSDRTMKAPVFSEGLPDLLAAAHDAGTGIVIHVEKGLPVDEAGRLLDRGAWLLFKTPPNDFRSRFRQIERRARRRALPERASYLQTAFMP